MEFPSWGDDERKPETVGLDVAAAFCRMTSGEWDGGIRDSYKARVWTLERFPPFFIMLLIVDGIRVNSRERTGGVFLWDLGSVRELV